MFCPNCGKENQDDAKFCGGCGADLKEVRVSEKADGYNRETLTTSTRQNIKQRETSGSAGGRKPGKRRGLIGIIVVLAVILLILLAANAWLSSDEDSGETSSVPEITSGGNQIWSSESGQGLTVTSDAEYEDFVSVLVDGAEISDEYYTVESGSTIITLNVTWLMTLDEGEHTITINSTTGAASTTFTIEAADASVAAKADEVEVESIEEEDAGENVEAVTEDDIAALYGEITSSGSCGDALTWYYTAAGTLAIAGTGKMDNYSDDDPAPWDYLRDAILNIVIYEGVATIGSRAFVMVPVTDVVLPDSLTKIGNLAFWHCDSLISVTLGDGLVSIGESAFRECSNLVEISLPNSVTEIGDYAFWKCSSLERVVFSEELITIGKWAFANCSSLQEIIIPDSVALIDVAAFYECTSLSTVTVGTGVTEIENAAFASCTELWEITFEGNAPDLSGPDSGNVVSSRGCFDGDTVVIYYPADNLTWTVTISEAESSSYYKWSGLFCGGTISWESY